MERPVAATNASEDIKEKLRHLPPAAQAAYARFQATRSPVELDPVFYAILADFSPRKSDKPLAELPGESRLVEDLGFDSLAITEIVFFTEELFGITISNEEIVQMRTLDQLRLFVHRKVTAAPSV